MPYPDCRACSNCSIHCFAALGLVGQSVDPNQGLTVSAALQPLSHRGLTCCEPIRSIVIGADSVVIGASFEGRVVRSIKMAF